MPKAANTPSLEPILNTLIDTVIVIDETGIIQCANLAAEDIFGYTPNELVGQNVSVLMPSPYAREHDGHLKNYLKTGRAKIIGIGREIVAKRKNGTVFPVYLSVSEARQEGGRYFFTGVIRDITELKRYQDDLKKQGEFMATVLNTVRSLVLVLDRRGHIVNFNLACEEMTGYSFQEVAGKPFWDFFLTMEDRDKVVKNFLNWDTGRAANNFETQWLTKNGEKRLIAWSNSLLFDKQGSPEYIIGTGVDITERRQLERLVLEITKKEQQRLGEELHDGIAQHLVSTAIVAKVLEKKLTKEFPSAALELKRVIGMVNQAVLQTRELAQGLYALETQSLDLASSIKKLARDTEKTLGISFDVRLAADVHASDDAMAAHLYRITREAVGNAVKHGRCKKVRIDLKKKNAHEAELRIESDGKRFLKPANHEGLGLRIIRSRAALINASLEIMPGERTGTIVCCVFPVPS